MFDEECIFCFTKLDARNRVELTSLLLMESYKLVNLFMRCACILLACMEVFCCDSFLLLLHFTRLQVTRCSNVCYTLFHNLLFIASKIFKKIMIGMKYLNRVEGGTDQDIIQARRQQH